MYLDLISYAKQMADLTREEYLQHLNKIVRWWNDHDSGARAWTRMIAGGTRAGDNAATGQIGEYLSSVVGATNLPASGAWGDLTSIPVTAGDWDVNVVAEYNNAAAVTPLFFDAGASTTTGNSGTGLVLGDSYLEIGVSDIPTGSNVMGISVPGIRFSLSAAATIYFKVRASYTSGTPQAQGRLSVRRMR